MNWEELCQYYALFVQVAPLVRHGNYFLNLAESQDAVGNPSLAVICCNEAIDHFETAGRILERIMTDPDQWLCGCGTYYPLIPLDKPEEGVV